MSLVPFGPGIGGMSVMSNMGNSGGSMVMMTQSFSNVNGGGVTTSMTSTRFGPDGVTEVKSQVSIPTSKCIIRCTVFQEHLLQECQVVDGRTGEEKTMLERRLGGQASRNSPSLETTRLTTCMIDIFKL